METYGTPKVDELISDTELDKKIGKDGSLRKNIRPMNHPKFVFETKFWFKQEGMIHNNN